MPDYLDQMSQLNQPSEEAVDSEALSPDEYARRARERNARMEVQPIPYSRESPEPLPYPQRNDPYADVYGPTMQELQRSRGQDLEAFQAQLGQYVAQGRMPASYARQVMSEAERQGTVNPVPPRQIGGQGLPGVDIGGLTPGQAIQRVRETGQDRPQGNISPQEQALLTAQQELNAARLGPADRARMQQLATALRNIQTAVRSNGMNPVDAHNAWTKTYNELRDLQYQQSQVPVLEARVASLQAQHQAAVAATIEANNRVYSASRTNQQIHRYDMGNGTVQGFWPDVNNNPRPVGEPVYQIPQGFRNEQEVAQTIRQRQIQFWNQHFQGLPNQVAVHWPNRAAEIEHEARLEQRHYQQQAMQHATQSRIAQNQQRQEQNTFDSAYRHHNTVVQNEIKTYRAQLARGMTPTPPDWMKKPDGTVSPEAMADAEVRRRVQQQRQGRQGSQNAGVGAFEQQLQQDFAEPEARR